MSVRCPGCDHEVTTATARWCGRCGARLPRASGATATARINGHAHATAPVASRVAAGATAPGRATAADLTGPTATLVRGEVLDLSRLDPDPVLPDAPGEIAPDEPAGSRRTRLLALAVAVATITGVLALQPEPEVVYPPAGYAAGGEPTRSGRVSHAPLTGLPTEVAWTRQLAVPFSRTNVVVGETVALEIGGNGTVGRDPESGEPRWLRTDLRLVGDPFIGEVITGTRSDGVIVGLDPATGRTLWEAPSEVRGEVRPLHGSDFVMTLWRDTVTVLDPVDGTVHWTRDMTDPIEVWGVAPAGDLLVLSGTTPPGLIPSHPNARHLAMAVEARTGETRWVVDLPGELEEGRQVAGAPDGTSVLTDPFAGAIVISRAGEVLHSGLGTVTPAEDIRLAPGADAPQDDGVPELEPLEADGTTVVDGRSLGADVEPISLTTIVCCDGPATGRSPVVVTTRDSSAVAYDTGTGEELWRWSPGDGTGGVHISGWPDGQLRGVHWTPDGGARTHTIDPITGEATLFDDRPFDANVGSWFDDRGNRFTSDGTTYAVGAADGPDRWSTAYALSPGGGPALRDDVVAVPTTTGAETVELADGTVRWAVSVKSENEGGLGYRWSTPAIGVATVAASPSIDVFANLKPTDRLTGFDVLTGVSPWARTNDPTPPRGEVTLDGDRAFLAVGREIHGYDIETGRRAFAAKSVDGVEALAVTPTHIVGTPDYSDRAKVEVNRLEAIGIVRRDRSTAWRRPGSDICTPPAIATDVRLSGAAADRAADELADRPLDIALWGERSTLRAVEVETGTDLWELPDVGPVCRPIAVAGGRAVFLPTFEDVGTGAAPAPLGTQLSAVDVSTGAYDWSTSLPSPATTAPVIAGEHVVLGLADGSVVAVALDSGEVVHETQLDGIAAAPPVLSPDGTMVVLLTDGRLVALR